ncbi:BLUF domain-containing protein [Aquimarina sp. U1-2]|uniref:BLUF domain-containing protein n=1 Tax=Aquimarina sp. U1-2 TaxID=2823141 RepID=UPI001AECD30B|nr:BLUF domain-containing protein [Aquimarina sp. U1-2]MBP2831411.1 BLUF domain-containing protein [Aquimarina sp. U1-2]
MFELKESSPLGMLRQFAVNLNATLHEDLGASSLILNNENGKGRINLYEVFPGLTAWIYNIEFNNDYKFIHEFSKSYVYYFGYHVSGYQLTKFPYEEEYNKIEKGQNFILTGKFGEKSEFVIPAKKHYECCYLIVQPDLLNQPNTKTKTALKLHLAEVFSISDASKPFRYFGNNDLRTGIYAELIVRNKRTDLVGRLLTESAILNMLASQIEAHDYDQNTENFQPDLSKQELQDISSLGDYIQDNIDQRFHNQELAKKLGVSQKKLQRGVRFLFGYSINKYIINIRLERARELFITSDLNVSEICYKVGYASRSHFAKQFYNRYGVFPNHYRNSLFKENILFEVSYRLMAKTGIDEKEITDILSVSRKNNKVYDITGSLIYHRGIFFQLIEGSKKDVLYIYDKIKKDKRHFDVQTIWQGTKMSREFENWNMAMISDEGILNIPSDGNTKNLNLGLLVGEISEQALESKNLWGKVRNILKTI